MRSARGRTGKSGRGGAPIVTRLFLCVLLAATALSCSYIERPYYRHGARESVPFGDDNIDHRLLLIGDAGAPDPDGEPTLQALEIQARRLPQRTTIVFLGDNVYERGMPEMPESPETAAGEAVSDAAHAAVPGLFDSRKEAEREIDAQIEVARASGARAVFVPGNHDWDQFALSGWGRIRALGAYIEGATAGGARVELRPRGGCPGPDVIPLGAKVQLIALDTQWWLETRDGERPAPDKNPTNCAYTTQLEVQNALVKAIAEAEAQGRSPIIVGHHPLETEGPHGGFVDIRTHLFPFLIAGEYVPRLVSWIPLPIIGSMVVGLRACCSPSVQDYANGVNRHMRRQLRGAMEEAARKGHPALLYAAGHDHSLQLFESRFGPRYTAVSGLGSSAKASAVGRSRHSLFAHSNSMTPGFLMVDFHRNGNVRLSVVERTEESPGGEEVYSTLLQDAGRKQHAHRD